MGVISVVCPRLTDAFRSIHKLLHGITDVNLHAATADADVVTEAQALWGTGVGTNMKNIMYYI